ncbi:MAG: carboxypeptidase regulatory-like domain-containing protein [Gemmatimonadaceae bacterium]
MAPELMRAQDVAPASATQPTYRLTGVVTDPAREPVQGAELVVIASQGPARSAATDARGRFNLGEFTAGTLSLQVRRLGYERRMMDVQVGAGGRDTSLEVVLSIIPEELENVLVSGAPGRLNEFFQRREQRAAFGRFLDREQIRKKGPTNASDLFRNVPGISIRTNPSGGNSIRIRNCQPMVWIDAQRSPGAELDEVITPGDIAAIEFYPSSAGVPAQYLERNNRLCGLILVWTKVQ